MHFVFTGQHTATNINEQQRIEKAAKFLGMYNSSLRVQCKDGWREIHPIADRYYILRGLHDISHCHADKLYISVRKNFFWKGMRHDCHTITEQCAACRNDKAKYLDHTKLNPINKGLMPFRVWSVDLIVELPPGSQGQTICIVAVCVFSKLVVAGALQNKSSLTCA